MNTFGRLFRLTTFGESHGPAMGAVVDGCPSGIPLAREWIQTALDRRRPGQSALTTSRAEPDSVEILSGVYEGKTLGTPIAMLVRNVDARSADYTAIAKAPRPGHADAVWRARYGHVDPRGGGRTSGRETVGRVLGGAVASAMLAQAAPEVRVGAWIAQVGALPSPDRSGLTQEQTAAILEAKSRGESLGGRVGVEVTGLPIGLGEPVFEKIKSLLASALLGIGTASGFSIGASDLSAPGSLFHSDSAHYGGVQGGLTNGEPLLASVQFKPPATLGAAALSGRHDPCILPRVLPVVESMVWLVLADLWRARGER